MRRVLAIITALTVTLSCMTAAFAADGDLSSADALMSMSDAEKAEFVNENLDVKTRHLSTLATLSADMLYDEIADEVKPLLTTGLRRSRSKRRYITARHTAAIRAPRARLTRLTRRLRLSARIFRIRAA